MKSAMSNAMHGSTAVRLEGALARVVGASVCSERVVLVAKIATRTGSASSVQIIATGTKLVGAMVVAIMLAPVSVTTCTRGLCAICVHMEPKARIATSTATTQRRAVGGVTAMAMQNADAMKDGPAKAARSALLVGTGNHAMSNAARQRHAGGGEHVRERELACVNINSVAKIAKAAMNIGTGPTATFFVILKLAVKMDAAQAMEPVNVPMDIRGQNVILAQLKSNMTKFTNLRVCMGMCVLMFACGTPRVRLWEGAWGTEAVSAIKMHPLSSAIIAPLRRPVKGVTKNAHGAKRVLDTVVVTAKAAVSTASTALAENFVTSVPTVHLAMNVADHVVIMTPAMLTVAARAQPDIAIVLRGMLVQCVPSVGRNGLEQSARISATTVLLAAVEDFVRTSS